MKKTFSRRDRVRNAAIVSLLVLSIALLMGATIYAGFKYDIGGDVLTAQAANTVDADYTEYDYEFDITTLSDLTTKWTDFNNALNLAKYDNKVTYFKFTQNMTWNSSRTALRIGTTRTVVVDLNGCTISRGLTAPIAEGGFFKVQGTLVLMDSAGGGALSGGWSDSVTSSGIHIENTGKFIMNGGVIKDCKQTILASANSSKSASVEVAGEFIMNGGTIENNLQDTDTRGGVRIFGGKMTMNAGEIKDNKAYYCAGVSVGNESSMGEFIMNGGTISGNTATGGPAAGVSVSNGIFTMNGGSISGNAAAAFGGGVAMYTINDSTAIFRRFIMNGGTISGNVSGKSKTGTGPSAWSSSNVTAAGVGGGVCVDDQNCVFIMNGGAITGNEAASNNYGGVSTDPWGGGLIARGGAQIYLMGGEITNNKAYDSAGVQLSSCTAYIGAVTIQGNAAYGNGKMSGIICENPTKAYFVGGAIISGNVNSVDSKECDLFVSLANTNTDDPKNKVNVHRNAGTVSPWAGYSLPYKGFYNDDRAPHIGLALSRDFALQINFTSGLMGTTEWPGNYFFANNSNYVIGSVSESANNHEAALLKKTATNVAKKLDWQVQLNDSATWYDANDANLLSKLGGATIDPQKSTLTYTYGGLYVTGVRVTQTHHSNGSIYVYNSTDTTAANLRSYQSTESGSAFSAAKIAGVYSLTIDVWGSAFNNVHPENVVFNIIVKPKNVTVELSDSKSIEYGSASDIAAQLSGEANGYWNVASSTPLISGEKLGIKVSKSDGLVAGFKYTIWGNEDNSVAGNSNKNYNITFANSGAVTMVPRSVTVLLNDDYATYADPAKDPKANTADNVNTNSFLTKTQNTSAKYKNEDGTDKQIGGKDMYKGGWQYDVSAYTATVTSSPNHSSMHQFVGTDLSSGVPQFKYTFTYASSNYNSGDSDKWLNVGDYTVSVVCENSNYNVTFKAAQDAARSTIKYSIRNADLSTSLKEPSETAPVIPDYKSATYTGTSKTIAVPDVALTVKGYQGIINTAAPTTSTSSWYLYIVQKIETGVTLNVMPTSRLASDWTAAGATSSASQRDKGTYKIYVLVSVPNHNPQAYAFDFALGASKVEYKIILKQKPNATGAAATLSPTGGAYSATYNGQAVVAEISYAWDYDPSNVTKPSTWDSDKPTVGLYYKSMDAYGYGSSTADPDESEDPTTHVPRGLGNKIAPLEAGSYRVTMAIASANSNYNLTPASGFTDYLDYKIDPMELTAPAAPNADDYDGQTKTFSVTLPYVSVTPAPVVTVGKETGSSFSASLPDGLTEGASTANTKVFETTAAGDYVVSFRLPFDNPLGTAPRNYKWKNSTASEATVTVTVNQLELRVGWRFTETKDNATAENLGDKKANVKGEITYVYNTAFSPISADIANVKLQYWYQYIKDAQGNDVTAPKVEIAETDKFLIENLKYNNSHEAGTYLIGVQLFSGTGYETNANYKFDSTNTASFSKEIKITAGDVELGSVGVQYTHDGANFDFDDSTTKFVYETDSSGNVLGFTFGLDFSSLDYMEMDTGVFGNGSGVKYQKKDASGNWIDVTSVDGAGDYRAVYAVKVKDTEKDKHNLPADNDFSSTIFGGYQRNSSDPSKAQFNFPFTVERAEVNLSFTKFEIKVDGVWKDFDPQNPPEYTGLGFDVRLKAPYPAGIASAAFTLNPASSTNSNKGPGTIAYDIEYTLDDNHQYTDENNVVSNTTFNIVEKFDIAPQGISATSWTLVLLNYNGEPYQYLALNVADEYKDYIKYEYVHTVGGVETVYDTVEDFIDATGACSSVPVSITVRAKLDPSKTPTIGGGTLIYGLKDSTGKVVASVEKKDLLGSTKDIVNVSVLLEGGVFGSSVNYADIFTAKINGSINLPADKYQVNVLDSARNVIGEISTVDFATLDAGEYYVTLELLGPAAEDYILDCEEFKFTVEQKELDMPTINQKPVYNGDMIDITAFFDAKLQQYINDGIVTVDGAQTALAAGRLNTLILTLDKNYKWIANEFSDPDSADTSLADNGYAIAIDGQDATYTWQISPYVLSSSGWKFATDGATYNPPNAPQWLQEYLANGVISINVYYYENRTAPYAIENPEIKAGMTFFVNAVVTGDEAANFVFENGSQVGDRVSYTVPKSNNAGAKIKEALTGRQITIGGKTIDLMLPLWVWILIIVIVLIILILLIILLAKRRKKKKEEGAIAAAENEKKQEKERLEQEREDEKRRKEEEREEEKRQREEEKRRKEEEREEEKRRKEEEREEEKRRKEEEREEEKRRRDEDREDERRRREDERSRMAMGGVGMAAGLGAAAGMMQQPQAVQQPQIVQQPIQPQPQVVVQAPASSESDSRLDKLEEELKRRNEELRKEMQMREDAQREEDLRRRNEEMRREMQQREDAQREAERRREDAEREMARKREEERLEQMKLDAQREAERIKEEARKAMEEMQQQQAMQNQPQFAYAATVEEDMDAETYARLREYEDRLRSMEREMQERRMETIVREENARARKELEDAARTRQHEAELQRLRDLQDYERRQRRDMPQYSQYQPQYPPQYPSQQMGYPTQGFDPAADYAKRQHELELQHLKLLEEQLMQKEMENQLLQKQLQQQYGIYPPPYPPQYPTPNPQMPQNPINPNGDKK